MSMMEAPIAGPVFAMTLKNIRAQPSAIFASEPKPEHELPGTFASFFTALLPVVLLVVLFQRRISEGLTSGAVKG